MPSISLAISRCLFYSDLQHISCMLAMALSPKLVNYHVTPSEDRSIILRSFSHAYRDYVFSS